MSWSNAKIEHLEGLKWGVMEKKEQIGLMPFYTYFDSVKHLFLKTYGIKLHDVIYSKTDIEKAAIKAQSRNITPQALVDAIANNYDLTPMA